MDIDRSEEQLDAVAGTFMAALRGGRVQQPAIRTMQQHHTDPTLLRVGDDNLCAISLGKEDEEFAYTLRKAVALTSPIALLRAADDEAELQLDYEENGSTMDVNTAQRGAAEVPGKGKAATSAKHKKKQARDRSHSGGTTRNRSRSKPSLSGTHDSDSDWETDDETTHPARSSHQ
eukprot:jgi/Tetstr1/427479/TSEL_017607.t1